MKKFLALCLGLMATVAVAKTTPNTDHIFKEYIIQNNNLDKCLFPEIYQGNENEVLEKWWSDTENNGRMKRAHYLKLKMRLAQKVMPADMAEKFLFGGTTYQNAYEQAKKRYGNTVSIKSKKACEKVGIFATNLIEEYDESNDKWRRDFKLGDELDVVANADRAIGFVIASVKKNKLLSLPLDCVSFVESGEDNAYFHIDIREKHNEKCGGDPQSSPRIMSYQVHKSTGKLCTDSPEWAEKLKAADPYNFECRPIH